MSVHATSSLDDGNGRFAIFRIRRRPVEREDSEEFVRELRIRHPHAELLNVFERAPVEVLAPDKYLTVIDDEVLRVLHAAHHTLRVENACRDAVKRVEPRDGFGVQFLESLVDEEADRHAALRCPLHRRDHGLEPAARFAADVELFECECVFRAVDHLHPHFVRLAQVRVVEARFDRGRFDEFDRLARRVRRHAACGGRKEQERNREGDDSEGEARLNDRRVNAGACFHVGIIGRAGLPHNGIAVRRV